MSESEGQEPEESILGRGAGEPGVPVTVGQPTQPAWMPSTMPGASPPAGAAPQPAAPAPPPPPTASTWPTPTTTYTDTAVVPGKTYMYEIESSAGSVVSSRIPVEVKTPVPSLSQARLEGTFNVSLTAVSHSGFSSFNSKFTLGWQFTPKC